MGTLAFACGDDPTNPGTPADTELAGLLVLGDSQVQFLETELINKLSVQLVNQAGIPIDATGVPVEWGVLAGMSSGRPTLYVYLLSAFFKVFGASEMVLRSLPIAIGVITVGVFYLLARHVLGQVPGLAAAFLLAVSRWQINFSRISWEASMMPLMVTLSLFFLFKALETKRWYYFAATGVALGAGMYTYLAFRFVPVILVLLVGYIAWRQWPLIRQNIVRLTMAALVGALVFLPLGIFAFTHQDDFFHRATQIWMSSGECQFSWARTR